MNIVTLISSGTDLLGSVMPLEVLHMLQSETGICALTFGDRNLKRRFYYKLYASLEQGTQTFLFYLVAVLNSNAI